MNSFLLQLRLRDFLLTFFSLFIVSVQGQPSIDKGIDLFQDGKVKEARSFFEGHLKTNKKDAEAIYYIGRTYFVEKDYDKATDWFDKAVDHDKENSNYHMWLGHSYGRRAQDAPTIKQPFLARNSRKNYEKAVELSPNNIEARESLIEYYLQAPGFLGGGVDKAESEASEIKAIDPVAGGLARGRIYTYTDQIELALMTYENLIDTHPNAMAPYSMLYTYLFNEGDFERAIEVTNKQISHNDTTASIYLRRGDAFQRAELFDEAMEDYIKVLSMDSSMYGVHYQIGRLAAVSGTKLELGEESIKKFNSKSELFDEVTLAWAHFRLGTIYEHKKENELAKREYEITLQLDKNHQEAKQALARLN